MAKNIMQYESVLPENFDGTFRFTNWSDEDFVGRWGSKDYRFPSQTTSPLIIPDRSPLEIQQIRKKFAKDLAEREFFKSSSFGGMLHQERNDDGSPRLNSIHQATTYNLEQLAPYIQRCLDPLPISQAKVSDTPRVPLEEKLSRNEEGQLNTEVVDKKISLRKRALEA